LRRGFEMIISKITSKAQTTIPLAVRKALKLKEGDSVLYVIDGDEVTLRRVNETADDDPFATFSEWLSDADCAAYADL